MKKGKKAGWGFYHSYGSILRDKKIPMSLRAKIINTCWLPILTYGAETWSTNKNIESKLAITQRKVERSMLGVKLKDKIKNKEIKSRTKFRDIVKEVKKKKWKWAVHVIRRNDNRWSHRLTNWFPREGKRKPGRQKTRWEDDIKKAR